MTPRMITRYMSILCLWRFGRLRDAEKVFTRMLWLNRRTTKATVQLLRCEEGKDLA